MPEPDPPRGRDELLELLEARRRAFHQLPFDHQAAINMNRILPVDEMGRLLNFYLFHGYFADESPWGHYRGTPENVEEPT